MRIGRPGLAAGATMAGVVLLLLLPLSGLALLVGTEAVGALRWLTTGPGLGNTTEGVQGALRTAATRFGVNPDTAIVFVTEQLRPMAEALMGRTLSVLAQPSPQVATEVKLRVALVYQMPDRCPNSKAIRHGCRTLRRCVVGRELRV